MARTSVAPPPSATGSAAAAAAQPVVEEPARPTTKDAAPAGRGGGGAGGGGAGGAAIRGEVYPSSAAGAAALADTALPPAPAASSGEKPRRGDGSGIAVAAGVIGGPGARPSAARDSVPAPGMVPPRSSVITAGNMPLGSDQTPLPGVVPSGNASGASGAPGPGTSAVAAVAAVTAATVPAPSLSGAAGAPGTAAPGGAAGAGPVLSPGRDTVVCPKCGKTVGAAYAFCGSCGQRLKPSGAAPPAAAAGAAPGAVPRTMFMGPGAGKAAARGHLTLIRPDGTEGGMHPLHEGENLIGRGQGSLFDADPYLSPRHAEFVLNDEGLTVRDLRSLNGVFIKIIHEEKLDSGDIFRIGQELLRFDLIAPPAPLEDGTEIIGTPNPGYWGRIAVIVGRDVDGPAFPLFDESIVLGRERGDILFPEDGYVSGTHAQLTLREGTVFLSDLGSSNGTFFRLRGSRTVGPGTLILMGQQLFRVAFR